MSTPRRIDSYIRARMMEVASVETRAVAEPLAEWAVRRIRLDGKPFSFEGHEFLRAIYDDTAPHIVLCKAAQVGGTTWAVLRAIHSCIVGLNTLYLFPTKTDVVDFSRSRVNPLISENAFLAKLINDTDNVGLKRIGSAHLHLRGMQSEISLKSVPADVLIMDELDEATPDAKAMARERLSHSDYRRVIELSNPSIPGYGIDEAFEKSDQRSWTVQCPSCGEWIALDQEFPRKLGEDVRIIRPRKGGVGFYRACPKCEAELDMAAGEWVPLLPSRSTHGYRISQLISSKVDPGEILEEYRSTRYPERFYNLKIGIAWADLERRLDAASVLALCGDWPIAECSEDNCVMGVDTGRGLHTVVIKDDVDSPTKPIVYLTECHTFEELGDLIKKFKVDLCVIDAYPETFATRQFAKQQGGRVYMCQFVEAQRGEPKWDGSTRMVTINRTDFLDASRAAIRQGKVSLPRRQPIIEEFATHLTNDAKVLDEDEETGLKKYRYIKTGVNHFDFAFSYAWMGVIGCPPGVGFLRYMRAEVRRMRAAGLIP